MNIELIIQSIISGKAYEISQLVSDISWSTDIGDQPGKLELEMIQDSDVVVNEGDPVRMKYEGRNIFFGRVFKKSKNSKVWNLMAYDNKRYLANEDTLVFSSSRSDERFTNICRMNGLPSRVRDRSTYRLPQVIHDQKSYYAMMEDAFTHTIINSGMWYIITDNFGTLEHIALNSMITNFVIGDQSLATDFDYESSIDDSYNMVKLTKDNEETNKRDVYIVRNSNLENRWGTLQYHQNISDDLNAAQIRDMANNMLRSMQQPSRSLKISSLGVKEIKAGNSVVIQFSDLAHEGYNKPRLAVIEKCTHNWAKNHTMDLEMRIV